MKKIIIPAIAVGLSACAASTSDETESVDISGTGVTQTISRDKPFDLNVSSLGGAITLESGHVLGMNVSGSNNIITVAQAVTIDSCTLSGSDNTLQIPVGYSLSCSGPGSGNQIIPKQ